MSKAKDLSFKLMEQIADNNLYGFVLVMGDDMSNQVTNIPTDNNYAHIIHALEHALECYKDKDFIKDNMHHHDFTKKNDHLN
jgi:hypothetical protein